MIWRNRIGSGRSPGDIRTLQTIELGDDTHSTHLAFDRKGGMHIVFKRTAALYYSRAAGPGPTRWTRPVQILPNPRGKGVDRPQLILDGDQACLIYEHTDGAFLRGLQLGKQLRLTPPVQITHHLSRLNGTRLRGTPDGHAVLLAGTDTVWRLRAPWADLFPKDWDPALKIPVPDAQRP
jgi:hypothetical protein